MIVAVVDERTTGMALRHSGGTKEQRHSSHTKQLVAVAANEVSEHLIS